MSQHDPGTRVQSLPSWATRELVEHRWAGRTVGVMAFVVATSLAAQVAMPLPWTPVPMTLQPMLVLLAGAVLGPWLGAAAMASYLAVGMAGAPVFAGGGAGVAWLMGPTGGYLAAYPATAFLVGMLAGTGEGRLRLGLAFVIGMLAIYAGGVSQLLILSGGGPGSAVSNGVIPFLGGDLVKVLIALLVAPALRSSSLGRR